MPPYSDTFHTDTRLPRRPARACREAPRRHEGRCTMLVRLRLTSHRAISSRVVTDEQASTKSAFSS